jgi:hypothetical protein
LGDFLLWQSFENDKSSFSFIHGDGYALIWKTFWSILSQTHLVTLA